MGAAAKKSEGEAPDSAASSERLSQFFLGLARVADGAPEAALRRRAEFFDGCHWLALGGVDEAAARFRRVRAEIPEAEQLLKKIEADRLRLLNQSALEAWELYHRESEAGQKDVDGGYLARFFSNAKGLEEAREKRFGAERNLIQELKRRFASGESATLAEALGQIQERGPEDLKDLASFLLSRDARRFVGDPRPALIDFASDLQPHQSRTEFLLQRSAELERQNEMPATCYAILALVRGFHGRASSSETEMERLSSGEQFAATLAKLALSTSAEGLATDVALMFASAGFGNLAKLSALSKLEKAGVSGYRALALTEAGGIGAEATTFWAGNTMREASLHDPQQVLRSDRLAQSYGASLLTIVGLRGFGKLGEGLGQGALARGLRHGLGIGGLTATGQVSQSLGWQETPEGGFSASLAGDVFTYAKFAAAHRMADHATGQALSRFQERQSHLLAERESKLRPLPSRRRSPLLHPALAPLWSFMASGGVGGGGGRKASVLGPAKLYEDIKTSLQENDPVWHHQLEWSRGLAAGSHRGQNYTVHNEDRYFFSHRPDGKVLMAAIDGLGGHLDGEQAAEIVRRAFEAGARQGDSVAEMMSLAHLTVQAYIRDKHPPSPGNLRGRFNPGAVASVVEITPEAPGRFTGRFWNIGDAEAVVLRLSAHGSVEVIHHTLRPTSDSFERKKDGQPYGRTEDGRLQLADLFEHRLLDSPVESFLGDHSPVVHYQRKELKAGDIVLVGSDGFFENFRSYDLIGKVIAQSGARTSAQVHQALFRETLIRMALLDLGHNKELTHEIYVEAYRRALGQEPPAGWKGMYEPSVGPDGRRRSYMAYYRGILDQATGQVVDTLKHDNLTLLVRVLGEEPESPFDNASSRRRLSADQLAKEKSRVEGLKLSILRGATKSPLAMAEAIAERAFDDNQELRYSALDAMEEIVPHLDPQNRAAFATRVLPLLNRPETHLSAETYQKIYQEDLSQVDKREKFKRGVEALAVQYHGNRVLLQFAEKMIPFLRPEERLAFALQAERHVDLDDGPIRQQSLRLFSGMISTLPLEDRIVAALKLQEKLDDPDSGVREVASSGLKRYLEAGGPALLHAPDESKKGD